MIFPYTESGTIDIGGQTISSIIDSDAPEYVARAEWIARKAGVRYVHTIVDSARSPGDPTANFTGTAYFQLGDEPGIGVDALAVRYYPHAGVVNIAKYYGLKVSDPGNYQDMVLRPLEDWELPGARIGPPLPGRPGRYQSRNDGGAEGDEWIAMPVGRKYRLVRESVLFASIWYWKAI